MAKLTLSVDREIVDRAKSYAARHKTSLSKLVSAFFKDLSSSPRDEFFERLHQELLREGFVEPKDDFVKLRLNHLTQKYL